MGGFFGTISKSACSTDLFYGTDYNSHLGTRRGGMATYDKEAGFTRSIHNLESSYFVRSSSLLSTSLWEMPESVSSAIRMRSRSSSTPTSVSSPS